MNVVGPTNRTACETAGGIFTPATCADKSGGILSDGGTGLASNQTACEGNATGYEYVPAINESSCKDASGNSAGDATNQSTCEGTPLNKVYTFGYWYANCSDGTYGGSSFSCGANYTYNPKVVITDTHGREADGIGCDCSKYPQDDSVDLRWVRNQSAWLDFIADEGIADDGNFFSPRMEWLHRTVDDTCDAIEAQATKHGKIDDSASLVNIMSRFFDHAMDLVNEDEVGCAILSDDFACNTNACKMFYETNQFDLTLTQQDYQLTAMGCTGDPPLTERNCWPSSFQDGDGYALGTAKISQISTQVSGADESLKSKVKRAHNVAYDWPCLGSSASGTPDILSSTCLSTGTQDFAYRTSNILAVARLLLKEESLRANTLNFVWNNLVDEEILVEGQRRREVLEHFTRNGAYLGQVFLRRMYFYDRFHDVFGRKAQPYLNHGFVADWGGMAFAATSSANEALYGNGGSISLQSTSATIDGGTRIVNSIAPWGDGGGLQCVASTVNLVGAIFYTNEGLKGGAIYSKMSTVDISLETTFKSNTAYLDGGGSILWTWHSSTRC